MTVSECSQFVDLTGRFDDCSDACIVSPILEECATVRGIVRISAIPIVTLGIALESCWSARCSIFSVPGSSPVRSSNFLLAGWHSSTSATWWQMMTSPVKTYSLACWSSVTTRSNTRTLQNANQEALDEADCSLPEDLTKAIGGYISRVMCTWLNRQQNNQAAIPAVSQGKDFRPHVNYFKARLDKDLLPDLALLNPVSFE